MQEIFKSKIREIPDWPQKGVSFKDITPLLADASLFGEIIEEMSAPYRGKEIDKVVGIDARGFLLAAPIAYKLKSGLALVRKKGKLPFKTVFKEYLLEYGSNVIEMHQDAVSPGEKVLLVDDVLATGGTMSACIELVEKLKGEIAGVDFLVELTYLKGREKLNNYPLRSYLKY